MSFTPSEGLFGAGAEEHLSRVLLTMFRCAWTDAIAGRKSGRPFEPRWFKALHGFFTATLEMELFDAIPSSGFRPLVESAVVHGGSPFAVRPAAVPWTCGGETTEIGDILFVVSRVESMGLVDREALLLQVKVGPPKQSDDSTHRELAMYANWPSFWWSNASMTVGLPGPAERVMRSESRPAAQVAVVPENAPDEFDTFDVVQDDGVLAVNRGRPLADEVARLLNLNLGVRADYFHDDGVGCYCWPRIIDDMRTYAATVHGPKRDIYRMLPKGAAALSWGPLASRFLEMARVGEETKWGLPWSPAWGGDNGLDSDAEFAEGEEGAGALVVSLTYYDGQTLEGIPGVARELGG
jgi:hypothetical protein